MKISANSDTAIAREKYKNTSKTVNRITHEVWVNFIESNKDYFIWSEVDIPLQTTPLFRLKVHH